MRISSLACGRRSRSRTATLLFGAALLNAATVSAVEWYRWRGPALNGISTESGWSTSWPDSGPKPLWNASVGIGFASVTVANGRAYTMGNKEDTDTVYCFNADTGEVVWKHSYPCALQPKYYEGGPGSTPTIDGARVFTFSKDGQVFCFDAASGKVIWEKHLQKELGLKRPEWGFAGSPLIEGDLLLLNAGSAGIALKKADGSVVWHSGKESASYSTPVPVVIGGKRCALLLGFRHFLAFDMSTGAELWRVPWKTGYDTSAPDPVLVDGHVFVASFDHDGTMFRLAASGPPEVVWKDKTFMTHLNAAVLVNGHLYGFHGEAGSKKGDLKCVDALTGETKWSHTGLGVGSLMVADGRMIILSEKGELLVAPAASDGFKPISRAQVLGGKCWTVPVLSDGRIYCRNAKGDLVCIDVRAPKSSTAAVGR